MKEIINNEINVTGAKRGEECLRFPYRIRDRHGGEPLDKIAIFIAKRAINGES